MADYARHHELDPEQTEDLHYFIRAMDGAYLDWCAKKAETQRKTARQPTRRK